MPSFSITLSKPQIKPAQQARAPPHACTVGQSAPLSRTWPAHPRKAPSCRRRSPRPRPAAPLNPRLPRPPSLPGAATTTTTTFRRCSTCSRGSPTSSTSTCSCSCSPPPAPRSRGRGVRSSVSQIHLSLRPPARAEHEVVGQGRGAGLQARGLSRICRAAGLGEGERVPVGLADLSAGRCERKPGGAAVDAGARLPVECRHVSFRRSGHLDVLRWAREHDCPWDDMTCENAARGGQLAVLRWARALGCPWSKRNCVYFSQDEPETLAWVLQQAA